MRHLTHHLKIKIGETQEIIDYDRLGRPIIGNVVPVYIFVYTFAESKKMVASDGAVRIVEGDILFTVSDNEETRKIEINHTFEFAGGVYKIYGIDRTKKGLLTLNCERSSGT